GAVWFSFSGLGVARFTPLSRRWRPYRARLGLPGNRVLSLVEARDGSIWAGTQSGLYRFLEGGVEVFREAGGVELAHITGLAEDRHGAIWISSGAAFDGAIRYKDGVWSRFGLTNGLVTYRVHRITRDRLGNLWFATIGPRPGAGPETGAWMYDGIRFRLFGPGKDGSREDGSGEGLIDGRVYDVFHASDGSYWFATWGGLSHLTELEGGTWESFTAREGLATDRVWAVSEGPDGSIWVCYQINGNGVSRYRGGRWTHYRAADGLINDNVWSIATTADGDVWFGTEGGISRFDGFCLYAYPVAEEPFFSNVWPLIAGRDGSVIVGTLSSGIYRFRRDDVDPPRVLGTSTPSDDVDLPWPLRWEARDYGDSTPPEDLLFRTRIDDGDWSPYRRGSRLILRDLPPGLRRIEIQARDRDGNTAEPVAVSVRVRAGLWRRPESIAAVAAAAVAATLLGLWGLARYRHERALRERYRAALRQAADAVVIVGPEGRVAESVGSDPSVLPASGDRIQDIARGGDSLVADLLKGIPVEGIQVAGDRGMRWVARGGPLPQGGAALFLQPEDELRRNTWRDRVDRLQRLLALLPASQEASEAGVERLRALAQADLAARGRPASGRPSPVAPVDLLERVAREIQTETPDARLRLPDPVGLWNLEGDPPAFETIFREVLRNAVDASGTQPVIIAARNLSRIPGGEIGVEVTIDDRGPGLERSAQDRLFDPFFTTKETGRGLGLFRALRAAVRVGGSISFESATGVGTRVTIVLPATKEAARGTGEEDSAEQTRRDPHE
ncbi:MAG: hypothetical protein JXP34_26185, partial [Planctomycetes bacterium]|nr:hypothetical protein [Planctomycetota bacterium]